MDFELKVPKIFKDDAEKQYINDCCIGCDEILEQIKPGIASEMNIDENSIEIYQEDWGWALEFAKGKEDYLLALNNTEILEDNKTVFMAYTQVTRKEKGFLLNKVVDADDENDKFSAIVSKIIKKNKFETDLK